MRFLSPKNSVKGIQTPQNESMVDLSKQINTGEVTRAAFPNYVGTTPDYSKSPPLKMRGSMTEKNREANDRAKSLLTSGTFKTPEKFVVDNKDDRRIWPAEYRGANLSNCLYTTASSFNMARRHQKPSRADDPDVNYPIGGGQVN
jgi:hypothetical protein